MGVLTMLTHTHTHGKHNTHYVNSSALNMADESEQLLKETIMEELSTVQRLLLSPDEDSLNSLYIRLECLYGHLLHIHDHGLATSVVNEEVVELFRRLLNIINSVSEEIESQCTDHSLQVPFLITHQRGRPKYDLPVGQLRFLLEHGFTCSKISSMLGISESTVHRRMSENGLSVRNLYSNLSDSDLKEMIHQAHVSFPNAGYRLVLGWLNQRGHRVQEYRVRQLMREVDPVGVTNRYFQSIHRRTYSVASPQALWHVDGNHKLIR